MNIEIANRLVELRKKNGLSQEELAAKLGLSRQAVSKWERAEASPDTDNLLCLAKIYGVSLDEILRTDDSVNTIVEEQVEPVRENGQNETNEETPCSKRFLLIEAIVTGSLLPIVTIAYVLLGIFYKNSDWVYGTWASLWMLFLLITLVGSIFETIRTKKASSFDGAITMITLIVFFSLGYFLNAWNIAWVAFFAIPVYFGIAGTIDKIKATK